MRGAQLALLWHLHQPDYRDPETGVPEMPWARLHALRGYRDMVLDTVALGAPWTLNVVPVLLDQLDRYAAGGSDPHRDLSGVPTADLSADARAALCAQLVGGHPGMRAAYPRWVALAARLDAGERLDVEALRDATVWSTLAWFGATAARDEPCVAALRAKGERFSEADKAEVLAAADRCVAALPGQLRAAADAGAALSVSPYHHPILPLLVDVQHARRADPSLPADLDFRWPQDARDAVVDAVAAFEARFGRRPAGLWPSEGAVSPEVAAIVADAGLRWLVSDVGVLRRSEVDVAQAGVEGPWSLAAGLVGFFRDTALSDRIGFHHHAVPADAAVAELVDAAQARRGVITLALDGENPWENWHDAGEAWRRAMAAALQGGRGVRLDEAATRAPVGRVRRLHTGSWIGADLRVWSGHPDDHAVWRALSVTRAAVEASPARAAAMPHVRAAEGSDWAWWVGPEFPTPYAAVFQRLLRDHLRAAWRVIGEAPPAAIDGLLLLGAAPVATAPVGVLDPEGAPGLPGWRGAGTLAFTSGASMAASPPFGEARYGWDAAGRLWIFAPWRDPWTGDEPVWAEVDGHRVDASDGAPAATKEGVELRLDPDGVVLRIDAGGGDVVLVRGARRAPFEGAVRVAPVGRPSLVWWSV